ncbi:MAG: DUF5715 family protein [Terracidiphilus sp.]
MRRISFILLLTALLAAIVGGPAAHAAKAHSRASSTVRTARAKQKPAARSVRRAQTPSRRAVARVRPAVLRRSYHARPAIRIIRARAVESAATDQLPAVDDASLQIMRDAMPPPLRGSLESLVRQNQKTEADGLERIQDDDDLADRIARKMLVPVPVSSALTVNGRLPENRRYCRPWTATFLSDLAGVHAAQYHRPLEVTSAVRTVAYQKKLMRTNGNATAAEGDIASPHLTGATIDIAKSGMTRQEIGWMRDWLLPLEEAGMIDVEEEFQQSCFHITVYKSYAPPDEPTAQPPAQADDVPGDTIPGV